jgi:hypothetical protein
LLLLVLLCQPWLSGKPEVCSLSLA